jgi:hypothetical protein
LNKVFISGVLSLCRNIADDNVFYLLKTLGVENWWATAAEGHDGTNQGRAMASRRRYTPPLIYVVACSVRLF